MMTLLGLPPDRPKAPATVYACTRCGDLVEVVELPSPHIDPAVFFCAGCGVPKPDAGQ